MGRRKTQGRFSHTVTSGFVAPRTLTLITKIAGVASFVSRAALRYATGRFLPLSRSWQFSCPSPEDNPG
jgi:hypothetical protein